ncbi:MAG TPA: hypothetical protein VGP58_14435 [Pyrinomonadaceae bacterium]|nr:hypothetical protein [Pyrinomonadaceae bacterium]
MENNRRLTNTNNQKTGESSTIRPSLIVTDDCLLTLARRYVNGDYH